MLYIPFFLRQNESAHGTRKFRTDKWKRMDAPENVLSM